MGAMACQITSLTIVYSTVYSGADHRKHQSSASLASVWGIHRWPVNSPHKGTVTRKMFPFDDVIMKITNVVTKCHRGIYSLSQKDVFPPGVVKFAIALKIDMRFNSSAAEKAPVKFQSDTIISPHNPVTFFIRSLSKVEEIPIERLCLLWFWSKLSYFKRTIEMLIKNRIITCTEIIIPGPPFTNMM